MGWSKLQAKTFTRDLIKNVGRETWHSSLITNNTRRALLASRVLFTVLGQHRESVKVEDVQELWTNMLREAGLEEGGA